MTYRRSHVSVTFIMSILLIVELLNLSISFVKSFKLSSKLSKHEKTKNREINVTRNKAQTWKIFRESTSRLTGFGEGDNLRGPRVEVVQLLLNVVVALIGLGGGPSVTLGGGSLLIEVPVRVLVAAVEELARILTLVVDP